MTPSAKQPAVERICFDVFDDDLTGSRMQGIDQHIARPRHDHALHVDKACLFL
jgi:hypothetical protein